jgi:hypothetical protein
MDKVSVAIALGTIASWVGNYTATHIGKNHYEKQSCKTEIFDVGYKLVPQYDVPWYIHEGYSHVWIPVLMSLPWTLSTKIAFAVSIRFVALLALRAITNVVTVLPKSEPCDSDDLSFMVFFKGMCYDKVFSGHTAFAVLVSLAFVTYGIWPLWGGWLYSIGMAILLLITRGHYTVDIVLGAAFAYLSWHCNLPFMNRA